MADHNGRRRRRPRGPRAWAWLGWEQRLVAVAIPVLLLLSTLLSQGAAAAAAASGCGPAFLQPARLAPTPHPAAAAARPQLLVPVGQQSGGALEEGACPSCPGRNRRKWLSTTLRPRVVATAAAAGSSDATSGRPSSSGQRKRARGGSSSQQPPKNEKSSSSSSSQQQQAARKASPAQQKPRVVSMGQAKSAREAAYLAALSAERDQCFISDALEQWRRAKQPSAQEMGLALLVASVACREALALDYALTQLAGGGPLKLQGRQRVLLRCALASYKYCTRTPVSAIVNQAVELAKQYCGGRPFASFCNALLRKLPAAASNEQQEGGGAADDHAKQQQASTTRPLPECTSGGVSGVSVRTSHPAFLVQLLAEQLGGLQHALPVLEAGNAFPPTMARRSTRAAASSPKDDDEEEGGVVRVWSLPLALSDSQHGGQPLPMGLYRVAASQVRRLAGLPHWYVTNGTPAGLVARLAQGLVQRQRPWLAGRGRGRLRVLDLCAAPGGKGLALIDLLLLRAGEGGEEASRALVRHLDVTFNDVSEDKLQLIRDNIHAKLSLQDLSGRVSVKESMGDGATLRPPPPDPEQGSSSSQDGGYDVIIVDAPCTNTGVLARRPEARWRLQDGRLLGELERTQRSLLANAVEALLSPANPHAEVWYMTCSILQQEDEGMVSWSKSVLGLEEAAPQLVMKVLPGEAGPDFDGGFAACLRRATPSPDEDEEEGDE